MDGAAPFTLYDLPREDILFKHIFPHLHLKDLFHLNGTCYTLHLTIHDYFKVMASLDLIYTGPNFTSDVLASVVKESFMLRNIRLSPAHKWLQNKDLVPIIKSNANLEKLDIGGCNCLSNGVLQCLANRLPDLKELKLGECHWVSNQGIMTLIKGCSRLELLDISGCWELQDCTVTEIGKNCKRLKSLNVRSIYSVTDSAITSVARHCPDLSVLNIQSCWRVSDDGIRCLGEYCKKLRLLLVKDCRAITEGSLARLRARGILIDVPQKHYHLGSNVAQYLRTLQLQI